MNLHQLPEWARALIGLLCLVKYMLVMGMCVALAASYGQNGPPDKPTGE